MSEMHEHNKTADILDQEAREEKEEAKILDDAALAAEEQARHLHERAEELKHKAHKHEEEACHEREEEVREHGDASPHHAHDRQEDDHKSDHDEGHGKPISLHTVDLTVVVNGQSIELVVSVHETLGEVRDTALAQTQNVAQPPENWEIKDEAGNLYDPERKVGDCGLGPKAMLFLSLKAGVAGGH